MPSIYTGKNRLLAAIPADDFAQCFSTLEPIILPLRQVLQDATQPVEHVYFVESGVISILTIMADGSTIEVGMIGTEGMIGVASLLDPEAIAPHVIVQIPGAGLRMPLDRCKAAFDGSPAVRRVMHRAASNLLALSAQTAACKLPPNYPLKTISAAQKKGRSPPSSGALGHKVSTGPGVTMADLATYR